MLTTAAWVGLQEKRSVERLGLRVWKKQRLLNYTLNAIPYTLILPIQTYSYAERFLCARAPQSPAKEGALQIVFPPRQDGGRLFWKYPIHFLPHQKEAQQPQGFPGPSRN